ncbi:MAG: tRNA dihydrouridine synthase [Verrucomicrobiota bacterium]
MLPWFENGRFPLYLAPMAGFTDVVFRDLCKAYGADVMVTEFVMANKFLDPRGAEQAWETVDFSPAQRPMGVQIFGSEPAKMGEAARRIVDRLAPDFIDLNYGCPAPKVVDNCAGSSLLLDLPRLAGVASAVVEAVGAEVPVTAKIRLGWDAERLVAVEACRRLEGVGIEAIAIHGRTKVQGYRGKGGLRPRHRQWGRRWCAPR